MVAKLPVMDADHLLKWAYFSCLNTLFSQNHQTVLIESYARVWLHQYAWRTCLKFNFFFINLKLKPEPVGPETVAILLDQQLHARTTGDAEWIVHTSSHPLDQWHITVLAERLAHAHRRVYTQVRTRTTFPIISLFCLPTGNQNQRPWTRNPLQYGESTRHIRWPLVPLSVLLMFQLTVVRIYSWLGA